MPEETETAEEQQSSAVKNTVTIEEIGPCKKKITVEIPEETIKTATDEQYDNLRKQALVPGFRKGRAPRRLLEKRFGKEAAEQIKLKLLAQASDSAIEDHELDVLREPDIDFEKKFLFSADLEFQSDLDDAVISNDLRQKFEENNTPLSQHATASVEQTGSSWLITDKLKKYPVTKDKAALNIYENRELPDDGPLKFDFEVEVKPQFDLPQFERIPVERATLEVTDEQIDRQIEQFQRWAGVWTPREDAPVELDDQIIADVVLKVEDVEEEEKLDNTQIHVRQNGFVGAIPVDKLDELLVGAKPSQTKQITVEVPKTYFRQEYRGKKVDINIDIKDVKWLKPAPLDETFLSKFDVQKENELREKMRDTLRSRLERQSRSEMTEQIYRYLLDNTDFDLPLDLVAEHSHTLLQRHYTNLLMRGLSRKEIEEHMDQLRAGSDQQAKEQFKIFFIMDKAADKLGIDVSEEQINGRIAQLAIQRGQRPERMRHEMERDGSLAQFKIQVREEECIAKMLESAKITEIKATKKPKRTKKTAKKAAAPEKKQTRKPKTSPKKKTGD